MTTMEREAAGSMLLWSLDISEAGPSLSRVLPVFMVRMKDYLRNYRLFVIQKRNFRVMMS